VVSDVLARLDMAGVQPDEIALRRPTLDEVFFSLTGERPAVQREASEGKTR